MVSKQTPCAALAKQLCSTLKPRHRHCRAAQLALFELQTWQSGLTDILGLKAMTNPLPTEFGRRADLLTPSQNWLVVNQPLPILQGWQAARPLPESLLKQCTLHSCTMHATFFVTSLLCLCLVCLCQFCCCVCGCAGCSGLQHQPGMRGCFMWHTLRLQPRVPVHHDYVMCVCADCTPGAHRAGQWQWAGWS